MKDHKSVKMPKESFFKEIRICGIKMHKISSCELLRYIISSADKNKKTVIGNLNIHSVCLALKLPQYKQFINNSDLVFCDGFGVILGARILGYKMSKKYRATCADYIHDLILNCEKQKKSIFLLGNIPKVNKKAVNKMRRIAPELKVDGHHGYFDKKGPENEVLVKKINKFKPDILYIGFGMPLQERWLEENIDKLNAKVFLPLGACLDFFTGHKYRAPKWINDSYLEWFVRLVTEPIRLGRRYFAEIPLFLYYISKERLRVKYKK